jgi:hypothetical protein
MTEDRGQMTEVRRQKTEDRSLVSVDGVQVAAIANYKYQIKKA